MDEIHAIENLILQTFPSQFKFDTLLSTALSNSSQAEAVVKGDISERRISRSGDVLGCSSIDHIYAVTPCGYSFYTADLRKQYSVAGSITETRFEPA